MSRLSRRGPGAFDARTAWIWIAGGWALNFAWEVLQGPLYVGHAGFGPHLWACFTASLADVVIVAGLYVFVAAAAADLRWYAAPRFAPRLAALAAAGFVTAVVIELRALDLGKWSYAEAMPRVPELDVGLSPILQMVLIPSVLALASRRWGAEAPRAELG